MENLKVNWLDVILVLDTAQGVFKKRTGLPPPEFGRRLREGEVSVNPGERPDVGNKT